MTILITAGLPSCRSAPEVATEGGTAPESGHTGEGRLGTVKVIIRGLGPVKGNLLIRLVPESQAKSFPDVPEGATPVAYALPVAEGENTAYFVDLPYGRYAAVLFHDRNSNGKLDTIFGSIFPAWLPFSGWPREGYGFSCYDPGFFLRMKAGPPHFAESSFEVGAAETTVPLTLNYFWGRFGWTSLALGIPAILGAIADGSSDPANVNRCIREKGE